MGVESDNITVHRPLIDALIAEVGSIRFKGYPPAPFDGQDSLTDEDLSIYKAWLKALSKKTVTGAPSNGVVQALTDHLAAAKGRAEKLAQEAAERVRAEAEAQAAAEQAAKAEEEKKRLEVLAAAKERATKKQRDGKEHTRQVASTPAAAAVYPDNTPLTDFLHPGASAASFLGGATAGDPTATVGEGEVTAVPTAAVGGDEVTAAPTAAAVEGEDTPKDTAGLVPTDPQVPGGVEAVEEVPPAAEDSAAEEAPATRDDKVMIFDQADD